MHPCATSRIAIHVNSFNFFCSSAQFFVHSPTSFSLALATSRGHYFGCRLGSADRIYSGNAQLCFQHRRSLCGRKYRMVEREFELACGRIRRGCDRIPGGAFLRLVFSIDLMAAALGKSLFAPLRLRRAIRASEVALYLRNFESDHDAIEKLKPVAQHKHSFARYIFSLNPVDWVIGIAMWLYQVLFLAIDRKLSAWSIEAALITAMPAPFQVLAVGRPQDVVSRGGSSRLYIEGDNWQSLVDQLIEASSLLLVRLGDSPGLRWEIGRALSPPFIHKVVVLCVDARGRPMLPRDIVDQVGTAGSHIDWSDVLTLDRVFGFLVQVSDGRFIAKCPPGGREPSVSIDSEVDTSAGTSEEFFRIESHRGNAHQVELPDWRTQTEPISRQGTADADLMWSIVAGETLEARHRSALINAIESLVRQTPSFSITTKTAATTNRLRGAWSPLIRWAGSIAISGLIWSQYQSTIARWLEQRWMHGFDITALAALVLAAIFYLGVSAFSRAQ